jgi:hypothetical protein
MLWRDRVFWNRSKWPNIHIMVLHKIHEGIHLNPKGRWNLNNSSLWATFVIVWIIKPPPNVIISISTGSKVFSLSQSPQNHFQIMPWRTFCAWDCTTKPLCQFLSPSHESGTIQFPWRIFKFNVKGRIFIALGFKLSIRLLFQRPEYVSEAHTTPLFSFVC